MGLTGWVRNRGDGRVEAIFEGERQAVESMLTWCEIGSPSAQVDDVEVDYEEPTGEFTRFRITW